MPDSNAQINRLQRACPIVVKFCMRANTWRRVGDTGFYRTSVPLLVTGSLLSLHLTPSLTHANVPSTAAHGLLASSTSFGPSACRSRRRPDGHLAEPCVATHGPGLRGRRPRCGGPDRSRSSTGVESVVSGRFQARRDGYDERGRGRTTSRRDSIGGSRDGGFSALQPRVCFVQGACNGSGCRRLQPGDGASAGVRLYPDAHLDAMGPAVSSFS
jgi:hypothetical protein